MTSKERNNADSLVREELEEPKKSKHELDLISRQAAIDAVEKAAFKGVAKSAIESLPPVEPPKKVVAQIKVDIDELVERIKEEYEITDKVGEWIEHPKTKGLAKIYECPFCGDEVVGEKTNFCPNCGARKKGGETEHVQTDRQTRKRPLPDDDEIRHREADGRNHRAGDQNR